MTTKDSKEKICTIVGDPVIHSLSPVMHNAGYSALGLSFTYTRSHVKAAELGEFITRVKKDGIRGISGTAPHKVAIMQYLDVIDPVAQKIGAVNTIVNNDGILTGSNTDWLGIVRPLEKMTQLKGMKVAIIGSGGVARAALYGLLSKGASVTVYSRTIEEAERLHSDFDCEVRSIESLKNDLSKVDIVLNATPIGSHSEKETRLVPEDSLLQKHIVFEVIYNPRDTTFVQDAKKIGARVVYGLDMLLEQGIEQFELFTGVHAPKDAMKESLKKHEK